MDVVLMSQNTGYIPSLDRLGALEGMIGTTRGWGVGVTGVRVVRGLGGRLLPLSIISHKGQNKGLYKEGPKEDIDAHSVLKVTDKGS